MFCKSRRAAGAGLTGHVSPLAYEFQPLEPRLLLTSTLYLDYGDDWPSGVLNTTAGAIDNTTNGANPNIDGPRLSDASNNNYADGATVAITSINTLNPSTGADVRAAMTAFTRRFFEPFDISVVELIGTAGAANLNEASTILGNNEGAAENNDTYLLIGGFLINGTDNPNSNAFGTNAYGGLSTGSDINGDNDEDGTALVILSGPGAGANFNGPQNAHEAGHAFGLEHVYRQNTGSPPPAGFGADYDQLHQSELMSYLGYATQGGFNFFSRFPVMDGDGNNNQNTLANSPTPYDDLVDDPNIGPSGIEYVTGTGANDIITITKTGATTANVSLQAFNDAAYTNSIDFPGATGAAYSYAINTDRPLTIDTGGRNDRIILDGDLGNSITLRGMHGTDSLIVMGKNAANATYTSGTNDQDGLDDDSDLRGVVMIGGTTINFQEFELTSSVLIQDVTNLIFRTGGSNDDVSLSDGSAGQNRVTGDSDGVDIVTLRFTNVTNFTIDTGANDGPLPDDEIAIATNFLATGLQSTSVTAGAGNDELNINFGVGNPVPINGLTYNGGGGVGDLLTIRGGSFTNEIYTATGPGSGTISLDGSLITFLNLAPVNDTVNVVNLEFNATANGEVINIDNGPFVEGAQTTQISSGGATFELLNFANKDNVTINGLGGGDTFNFDATFSAAGFDTLTLNGDGGDDLFDLKSSEHVPITVNGGTHVIGDTLSLDGETLNYTLIGNSLTTAGRDPITYSNTETLALENGTFLVSGAIAPNVDVNSAATLYGVGNVQGTVTGNANGTIAPGATLGVSTGTLGAGGTILNLNSIFEVDLNGLLDDTEHDVLNVNGTVTINNADIAGTLGYASIPGDELVIIRNDGVDAVVGTFAQGDMVTIGGQKFAIDYAYDADGDGAFNDVALIRYGAALAPDPCDPALMALYVSATTGDDQIRFISVKGNTHVRVLINGVNEGLFKPTGLLIGFGQSGNDTITVEMPARESWLFGQVGDDVLVTGNKDSVLIGGFGDDHLTAGNGRDILIGGPGADVAQGGNGTDILIAGSTDYDPNTPDNRAALCGIQEEWISGHGGPTAKILRLMFGGGHNGANVLNSTTVSDDAEVDDLLGGEGKDWFLLNHSGGGVIDLSDVEKGERRTDI